MRNIVRKKQKLKEEKPKRIKVPIWLISIPFILLFLFIGMNTSENTVRRDYMDIKYENTDVQDDPFEKPDEPINSGGGGRSDNEYGSLSGIFTRVRETMGAWFIPFLVLPAILIFFGNFFRRALR